ncbi:hypothetical protein DIPPA_15941 [Diplonema papillatum]|nr:hypothetical protein DIPPA_11822 [Diplonema papillatum]KAJ9445616.1 hypothetical protein DIPPA_15941 [Diplonema papillatum]
MSSHRSSPLLSSLRRVGGSASPAGSPDYVTVLVTGDVPTQKLRFSWPRSMRELTSRLEEELGESDPPFALGRIEVFDREYQQYVLLKSVDEMPLERVQLRLWSAAREHPSYANVDESPANGSLLSSTDRSTAMSDQGDPDPALLCTCGRGEVVQFYSPDDSRFVCALCAVLGGYRTKQLLTLKEAAEQYKACLPSIQGKIDSELNHIARLSAHLTRLQQSQDPNKQLARMHAQCDELIALVEEKRKHMQEHILKAANEVPTHIAAERSVLHSREGELRALKAAVQTVLTEPEARRNCHPVVRLFREAREKLPAYVDWQPADITVKAAWLDSSKVAAAIAGMQLSFEAGAVRYPPCNVYRYAILGGGVFDFDISTPACARFGHYHLQAVRASRPGAAHEVQQGVVIGVLADTLWWHKQGETAASPLVDATQDRSSLRIAVLPQPAAPEEYPESQLPVTVPPAAPAQQFSGPHPSLRSAPSHPATHNIHQPSYRRM